MNFNELHDFYRDHLFNILLPFWMKNGIDHDHGAFLTCFNNAGDTLKSKKKYIWSQGRFLWMLSRLYYAFKDYMNPEEAAGLIKAAGQGALFLKEHALLANGKCAWVLDQKGSPILTGRNGAEKKPAEGDEFDSGIAADEFLIYGMAEYARAADNPEYCKFALKLFDSVYERLQSGDYKTFPHDTPNGYKTHEKSMIMRETARELADIASFFNDHSAHRLTEIANSYMQETIANYVKRDDKILLEMIKQDNNTAYYEILGSYVNPGHALEDAWFIMHFACRAGDLEAKKTGTEIVRWMATLGWDAKYGGLFQFLHKDGKPPKGSISYRNRENHVIRELRENWSNKLWWVHSEALYALILVYEKTGDSWFLKTYWQFHGYVFKTFPNPDKMVGEWIQIRDRKGNPEDKVAALPVKDPYHITRAFMHLIKSLERIISRKTGVSQ
jgi:N-acylglucosamine 2-epimerase